MAKEMGLDRAPIEFQTFYFSHVLVVTPNDHLAYLGYHMSFDMLVSCVVEERQRIITSSTGSMGRTYYSGDI